MTIQYGLYDFLIIYIHHVCLLCGTLSLIVALRPLFSRRRSIFSKPSVGCQQILATQIITDSEAKWIKQWSLLKLCLMDICAICAICIHRCHGQKFRKILHLGRSIHFHKDFFKARSACIPAAWRCPILTPWYPMKLDHGARSTFLLVPSIIYPMTIIPQFCGI